MSDYIIRGMAANNEIRFFACYSKDLVKKAKEIHGTSPVVTAALGRLLTAGSLMGSMCKNDSDVLTLQIRGDGPIGGITVTADSHANVKGYVINPEVYNGKRADGKLDVGGAVGYGTLTVIKDIGLKEPYSGQVDLTTGEIADDLTYYFAASEQIPTAVGLGVLMSDDRLSVKHAGGFIVQLMPFASEETIALLEKNVAKITSLTTLFNEGKTIEEVVEIITSGMDYEITEKIPTEYKCNCGRDRVKKALISVGKKEIASMIEDGQPITLDCHFCNSKYTFEIDELKDILLNH